MKPYLPLVLIQVVCSDILTPFENNLQLSPCIEELVEKFGGNNILYASNKFKLAHKLTNHTYVKIKIGDGRVRYTWPKFNMFFYELDDLKTLAYFLNKYRDLLAKSTKTNLLILNLSQEQINEIFKLTWKYHFVNILIINGDGNVYTYHPITNNCENIFGTFSFTCGQTIPKNVYNESSAKTFNRCKLRVSAIVIVPYVINLNDSQNPGFEIVMLKEIGKRLDLDIIFTEYNIANSGGMQIDGTFTEFFKLLNEGRTDVIVGDLIANHTLKKFFDATYTHAKIDLAFFVPAAKIVSNSKYYFIVFDCCVWITLSFLIIFISFVWYVIGGAKGNPTSFEKALFCTISILLNSADKQPNVTILRYMFIIWAFFSFCITSIYQAKFTTHLTQPNLEPQIETLEDLVASNLELGGYFSVKDVFLSNENEVYKKIYNKWVYCNLHNECIKRVADGKFALFRNTRTIRWSSRLFMNQNGRPKIYQMKTTSIMWLTMYVLKGLPMYDRINQMILLMYQNGLLEKYEKDSMNNYKASVFVNNVEIPLNLRNFKAIFFIYFVGNSLALVIFYAEKRK